MLSIVENQASRFATSAVSIRAAITGASCRLPGANNLNAFWTLMASQQHGLRQSPAGRYDALELTPEYIKSIEEIGHQWGGYIDGPDMFDPTVFGMSRIEASATDPQQRLILEVAWEALENACEAPEQLAGTRTGVFVGLSTFDYALFQGAFDPFGEHITPFSAAGVAHCIAANRISYMLDLRGPSLAIDTACSSSSTAIHMALRSLQHGECDAAIVCGANLIMTPYITKGFKRARMLAKDGLVKCFDEKTDGYVRAEGAVAVVIRREEDAVARGNRIMGVIAGSAVNHDGRTPGIVTPSHNRQTELIRAAHTAAGVDQNDIGFVEAHGTGTYRGDETELGALNEIFVGERDNPCYVGSVKSNLGHLEAASGLAGLLKATMCLEAGEIPGQVNLENPMPAATADGARVVVPTKSVVWPDAASRRWAGVSCLGFGGANSHIVIEGPPARAQSKPSRGAQQVGRPAHVMKLSAKKPEQLAQMAGRLLDALVDQPHLDIGDICYSANIGRADFEERAATVVTSRNDLTVALDAIANDRSAENIVRARVRNGGPKIAFLLSGQGTAQVGMARALYESEPRFAAKINAADAALHELSGQSLCDHLYDRKLDDGAPIKDPAIARVAVFATQCALATLLDELGVKPSNVISNGIGVHAAAVYDGTLSLADGVKVAFDDIGEEHSDHLTANQNASLNATIKDGADMVVEVGPQTLMPTDRCLSHEGRDVTLLRCLSPDASNDGCFAHILAALYAAGTKIDWHAYDAPFKHSRLALPTYPFARERFWFTDGGKKSPVPTPAPSKTLVETKRASAVETEPQHPTSTSTPAPALDRQTIFELIRQEVVAATPVSLDGIGEDTVFTDVVVDSIVGLQLLLRIERIAGVTIDPERFAEDMTFGAMIDVLHEMVTSSPKSNGDRKRQREAKATLIPVKLSEPAPIPQPKIAGLPSGASPSAATETSLLNEIQEDLDPAHYLEAIRPDFTMAMHELLFDVEFENALGDQLTGTRFGKPISAIDMLGGFGSTLFGHNHPALVGILFNALTANRPQFVQMSNRTAAGTLAKQLASRISGLTGRDYIATLGSTGGEMVDAALKHALFEWCQRRDGFISQCTAVHTYAPDVAGDAPVVLAIEGSYHGKTLGAYSLTWNAPGRDGLGLSGPFKVVWLPRNDEAAAVEVFARYQSDVATPNGSARLNHIAGLFIEPVQGEGGIFPLDTSYAATLRRLADDADCPIVVDEIQSGMGRTGAFCAASQIGLRGDYYIFGKSLGGGLTKLGALLIDTKRYAVGFGFAQSSTFAEDDHSALVGLGALRLLDDDKLETRAHDAGVYLTKLLKDLKVRYPDVLAEVRGVGLMVGIELANQSDNESQVISGLSDQELLGMFVASYLLHRQGVRVGTALSRPMTLRLEPSAYISHTDMDKTAAGIEAVCRIISTGDAADLLRHLAQSYRLDGQTPFRMGASHLNNGSANAGAATLATKPAEKRAVFLGHMIDSDDIGFWDKSLLNLTEAERENLAGRLVDPIPVKQMSLLSPSGGKLNYEIQSLPITSRAIIAALRDGKSDRIVKQVDNVVAEYARQGASVVGLGGLLSVITRNGLAVGQGIEGLQVTTGNTYTVALAAEVVIQTAREKHIDPTTDRFGIVGAGGNIGSTLVHILAENFQRFHLAGRKETIGRVERVADAVYDAALATLQSSGGKSPTGLAAALADLKFFTQLSCPDLGEATGASANGASLSAGAVLRRKIIEHYGTDPFLPVSPSIDALQDCSVIVTASNAIAPILTASNVGPQTKIICDISVPSDVDPELIKSRPDITMVRGGVARLPDANEFTLDMIDLPENHMLACMAETALLGFSGRQGFRAIGEIDAAGVRECHALGRKHGFELSYSAVEKPFAIELD